MKNIYVYRNVAIEYLFKSDNINYEFSGYGDVSEKEKEYDAYLFFYIIPYKFDNKILVEEINNYYERLKYIVSSKAKKDIYIMSLYQYNDANYIYSNYEVKNAVEEFNRKIQDLGENTKVIDIEKFLKNIDSNEIMDMKYYYLYNLIINPKFKEQFAEFINYEIEKYVGYRKKCLVLDLDNTLWSGIIGEDGIQNVKMNGDYPGNCYADFQSLIQEMKKNGIILCIASKNNKEDVDLLFEKRKDMILKKDDFVIIEASWNPKNEMILSIAKRLNISISDMVFIDDNPAERELVKELLSEVVVLDFPEEPYLLSEYYKKEFKKYFSIDKLTKDDNEKTKQYKAKIEADELKNSISSIDEYIEKLKMEISFEEINENNQTRIVELINKSNQFNLTTKRYSNTEIENMKSNAMIYAVRVKDKFDDLGIVGVSIINTSLEIPEIDEFLLSCRVIGRKIESKFLEFLLEKLKEKNYEQVKAKYIRTLKNGQVQDFYLNEKFDIIQKNDEETLYMKKI